MAIQFQAKGIGGLKIMVDDYNIYIDAFNKYCEVPELEDNDIIVFTHADDDHFDPGVLPDIRLSGQPVVGPPSIVKPLLEQKKVNLEQLYVQYPPTHESDTIYELQQIGNINIKTYNTDHFLGWKRLHASFMVEVNGLRIFIAGDHHLEKSLVEEIANVDYLVVNLVEDDYILGEEIEAYAKFHLLSQLLKLKRIFNPGKIIGLHLLDFEWTVNAEDMKDLIDMHQFEGILIPTDKKMLFS